MGGPSEWSAFPPGLPVYLPCRPDGSLSPIHPSRVRLGVRPAVAIRRRARAALCVAAAVLTAATATAAAIVIAIATIIAASDASDARRAIVQARDEVKQPLLGGDLLAPHEGHALVHALRRPHEGRLGRHRLLAARRAVCQSRIDRMSEVG
jgi:hypothetical protein